MFFVHATKSASIAEPNNLLLKMTDDQQFCLRWNDFQTNMVASFKHLRDEKSFCDVTIATEVAFISRRMLQRMQTDHQGQHTKAHKMILCACSPYFKNLLEQNPAKHPIIILKVINHFDCPPTHLSVVFWSADHFSPGRALRPPDSHP